MKTIKGFKFIRDNMCSANGDCLWKIGEWKKHEGELQMCKQGFHACRKARESLSYVYGEKWFLVEARGKIIEEKNDKFVASEMRLVKEIPIMILKRFALFCAKQSLKYFEKKYPDDKRVSECIRITELYLDGKATIKEADAAAADAAAYAADAVYAAYAAYAAADAAAYAAYAAVDAAYAAYAAAAADAAAYAAYAAVDAAVQSKELDRMIKEYLKEEKGEISGSKR